MGVLAVTMVDCDVLDVAELLRVDYEVTAVLRFERCLVSGGWVMVPFFHFDMTTGFNLLQLIQIYVTTYILGQL